MSRPVSYNEFRQRVRRHARTDLLEAVAALNVLLEQAAHGRVPSLQLPNVVQPFALGGIARTAIIASNEHRSKPVSVDDLVRMCSLYVNVEDPALTQEPGMDRMRRVLNRIAYEQFGSQFSEMENIGRTLPLLLDHRAECPSAAGSDDWEAALGVPLELFMRIGFAMHTAAMSNRGRIDHEVLRASHVAPIFTPLASTDALKVVDRWYAATPEELREAAVAEEVRGVEKWSLSPLVAKPIVRLADRYVMPWPRLVLDRFTPTGLYFIGLELFGPTFPEALGCMFQSYVGEQLRLLQHVDVLPEVTFGRPEQRTVDWFVVTPEVVVLVEVKAARPVKATRLGEPEGDEDVVKKVGYALGQIDRTADVISSGHEALAAIPKDRPIRGLVVTLEPFHLTGTFMYDDLPLRATTPTAIASSHELEGVCATLSDRTDVGQRLLDALTPGGEEKPTSLLSSMTGLQGARNPILDAAWERFTGAWSELKDTDDKPT